MFSRNSVGYDESCNDVWLQQPLISRISRISTISKTLNTRAEWL
jgi:hypothetical protein